MNRIKLNLIIIILSGLQLSQSADFGLKFGYTLSDQEQEYIMPIDQNISDMHESKNGLLLGVFARFSLYKSIYFYPELSYIQKGTQFLFEEGTPIYSVRNSSRDRAGVEYGILPLNLNYLSASFNFSYNFNMGQFIPSLFVGPRVDYLLSMDSEWVLLENSKEYFSNFNYGISLGFGVKYNLSSSINLLIEYSFQPDFTYSYDLSTIIATEENPEFSIKYKNLAHMISFGVEM